MHQQKNSVFHQFRQWHHLRHQQKDYNLSYNTKTEKSDTYASVGYLNDDGYMIKTDFERYSGRLNYNVYPTKWFKTGLNLGVTRTVSNYSTSEFLHNHKYIHPDQ